MKKESILRAMRRGVVAVLWALVVACSGASNTGLQDPNGSDGSVQDTGSARDTGTADAGSSSDGAMDAGKDVVDPPKDSGPPQSKIACGNTPCTSPNEICCRTMPLVTVYTCTMPNACTGLAIVCDKRQNCESMGKPGTVCCGHYVINGQTAIVNQIDCTQPSSCTQQQDAIVLCDPNDSSQCLQGQTCTLSQTTIPGYYFCK